MAKRKLTFEDLADRFKVEVSTARNGWVNVACPFCGDTGKHMGYHAEFNAFSCWRCGKHGVKETLVLLFKCSPSDAIGFMREFGLRQTAQNRPLVARPATFRLPPDFRPLGKVHRAYIDARGFSSAVLEDLWDVMGTSNTGTYKYRLGIPIVYNGVPVSYTTRDITGRAKNKYMSCPVDKEAVHHKDILYGLDKVPKDRVLVVEGPTKVWRLGRGSVATFGIKFTKAQIEILRTFKHRFVLFDNEPLADRQARRLADALAMFSGKTEMLRLTDEPFTDVGDAPNSWAKSLMRELKIH